MNKLTYKLIFMLYNALNNKKTGRKLKRTFKHYIDNIFYVLKYGIPWRAIKNTKIHFTTYHKFFKKLVSLDIFNILFKIISKKYYNNNKDKCKNLFIDSSMIKNINGRENLGRNHYDRNRKGNKITVLVNEFGMPVSLTVAAANTHDSKLIMSSINSSTVKIVRSRIIADKGYINARIKRKLRRSANISLIYPYRRNQNRNNTTFEKNLLKKRHIVENFFSWLKKYRRIQQRYDCTSIIYLNFVYFGTANLMINKLF